MRFVSLPPVQRLAPVAPLVVRVVVGLTMIAHGFHYGPVEFGLVAEQAFGVPFPMLIGWAVTLLLFGGGSLFVIGMLWAGIPGQRARLGQRVGTASAGRRRQPGTTRVG